MIEIYVFFAFVALCYIVWKLLQFHPADWSELKTNTDGSWAFTVVMIFMCLAVAVVLWPVLLVYLVWGWVHV